MSSPPRHHYRCLGDEHLLKLSCHLAGAPTAKNNDETSLELEGSHIMMHIYIELQLKTLLGLVVCLVLGLKFM